MGKSSRWTGWRVGVVLSMGLLGLAANAEPDPAKVREAMKRYEEAEEQSKPKPPAPKPRPKPRPRPEPAVATPEPEEPARPTMRGPALVTIRGGCFEMGSPESETGREPFEPNERQHQVCVKDFAIGPTEVTVGEFKRFVAASGYRTDAEKNAGGHEGCVGLPVGGGKPGWQAEFNWREPGYSQTDRQPVVCVSWNDAMAYTKWLSGETGQRYRLPTEAEWEYACRGGATEEQYCGDDSPDGVAWYSGNSGGKTHPVSQKAANGFGLYDMSGNVWEWTCSVYDKDYGGSEKICTNKSTGGPLAVRGGGWLNRPAWVRSANRDRFAPADRYSFTGFRLARSL